MNNCKTSCRSGISVIIPCYQQGHFLAEAIESVLTQTLPAQEIIVVDDGSTDHTAAVAARYPGVRYILQDNSGSAAARNQGLAESSGDYLVFLDADDRLLRSALEIGMRALVAHPECGFAFGRCQYIKHDGSPVSVFQPLYDGFDDYLSMLKGCPIWHPAGVMFRRSVLSLPGFDTSFVACSDYEVYLRVTRRWPIYCHNEIISEYRQHASNKSANNALTFNSVSRILRLQLPIIKGNRQYEDAYRTGIRTFRNYYYRIAISQLSSFVKTGKHGRHAIGNAILILQVAPRKLGESALNRLTGATRKTRRSSGIEETFS